MNFLRFSPAALLAIAILLFYGAFLGSWFAGSWEMFEAWDGLWGIPAVHPPGGPQSPQLFFDMAGVLSWRDCHLRGLDVMAVNPCDPLGRLSNYSPLWYLLPTGGRANLMPLSILMVGAFLAVLPMMFRPATTKEAVLYALAAASPMTAFAVERANLDILMFLMLLLAVWLWRVGRGWPAYGVVLAAAFLKFYPLALLGLAGREPVRRLMAVALLAGLLVALYLGLFWSEMLRLSALMPPQQYFGNEFGAGLFALGVTKELGLPSFVTPLLTVSLMGLCLWGALRIAARFDAGEHRIPWDRREMALLLASALVMCACFMLMSNIAYRGIFLLPALPGLLLLRRLEPPRGRLASWGLATAFFLLFGEMLRKSVEWLRDIILPADNPGIWDNLPEVVFFLLHEAIWWWLVALLLGFILAFLRRGPVFAMILGRERNA
jgi:hypothetical protein